MNIQSNLAKSDRILRIIAAIAFFLLGFISNISGFWKGLALVAGAVLLATAIFSFCPVYGLFGLDGRDRKI